MNESEAEHAFSLMTAWQWQHFDPDGIQSFRSIDLSTTLNRLAMQGHSRPKEAILTLLCEGRLKAICSYEWKKYQNTDRFALSGSGAEVSQNQWQALVTAMAEESRVMKKTRLMECKIDLFALGVKDCEIAVWEPSENRFRYALCANEINPFAPGYYEETFSAWEIMLMPLFIFPENFEGDDLLSNEIESEKPDFDKPLRKPLSDSDLKTWWRSKTKVRDLLTKDELLALVRAKFPDNHISRDRVRDLIGPRKQGPKPIRDKPTAK